MPRFLTATLLLSLLASAQTQTGPSFSCAHVTSQVNKIICASPALSALDRDLANVFTNMQGQPIDHKKLQSDEQAWLASLLHDCKDESCIETRYKARLAELRNQSLHTASPATYDETRPFPASPELLKQAQSLIGKSCSYQPNVAGAVIPGFTKAQRFLDVIFAAGVATVREKQGTRFAFLIASSPDNACHILDVVTLPATAVGDRFLQCSNFDPALNGFGVRNAKTHALDGFWAINPETHKIDRVPVGVLGIEKSIRCQQPENGE
jgi:uncharacterized protein YecT (DUF1311 family)